MRSMCCYKRALNNPFDTISSMEQGVKTDKKIFHVKRQALKE